LARVYNNDAIAVSNTGKTTEAQTFYEKAITLAEQLVRKKPENREYKVELSQYCSNEAGMLADANEPRLADERSQRALQLIEELARPTPSFSLKMVHAFQLRGQLLRQQDPRKANTLTDQAFDLLKRVDNNPANGATPFSALYMNIGVNYLELARDNLQRGDRTDATITLAKLSEILPHLSSDDKQILIEPYQNLQADLSKGPTRH
jgi:tetratricopeptide (TPR) repeat protein